MARILIVEDEDLVRDSMTVFLGMHHEILTAGDGPGGLETARQEKPDLIILDIGLPGMDGVEVCRQLRGEGLGMPVLFLTSRDREIDTLTGFSVGADDYIVKPVSLPVLQARVHAALRRASPSRRAFEDSYEWGDVRVNFTTHEVVVAGEEVELSVKEIDLLRFMIQHRGAVLTRETLLADVWQYEAGVTSRTVDTHILNLRRKLQDGRDGNAFIHTVRGRGYKFTG